MTEFRNQPSAKKNPIFDFDQDNLRSYTYQYSNLYSYDDWDLPETKIVEGRPHRVTRDDKGDEVGDKCVLLESLHDIETYKCLHFPQVSLWQLYLYGLLLLLNYNVFSYFTPDILLLDIYPCYPNDMRVLFIDIFCLKYL